MKSIQSHLMLKLASLMVVLSIVSGSTLFIWLQHSITADFDRSLAVRAEALEPLITQTTSGRLDIDIDLHALREFNGDKATEYFLFEDSAGKQISSSNDAPLTTAGSLDAGFWNSNLPNGMAARVLRTKFVPSRGPDEDEQTVAAAQAPNGNIELTLTVARNRQPLDRLIIRIALAIGIAVTVFSATAVLAAVRIVRTGLLPLIDVADHVRDVDFDRSTSRFKVAGLPRELLPIVDRLNEMLERVYQTIAKERQFTSAVSHELRTPIAELRSAVEVALREPANAVLSRRALDQAGEVAIQMQTMVATLLEIVSNQRAAEGIQREIVRIRDIIELAVDSCANQLNANSITVEMDMPIELAFPANVVLLRGIAENLVKNAASYSRPASQLRITSTRIADLVVIQFENQPAHDLTDEEVVRMFDPFWRKDVARSGGDNFGLGLTVVRAYCSAMNADISAQRSSQRLIIELRFRDKMLEPTKRERFADMGSAT